MCSTGARTSTRRNPGSWVRSPIGCRKPSKKRCVNAQANRVSRRRSRTARHWRKSPLRRELPDREIRNEDLSEALSEAVDVCDGLEGSERLVGSWRRPLQG